MSVELATAYVSLVPSLKTNGLPAIGDQAGASVGKRFSSGFAKTAKVGLAVGLGGVLGALGAVIKTGLGEAKDASAGTAQLEAGIKSTGGAAGVTADQLNHLASRIQGYSGQTDDSVVAAEKLLLTFTNIKNVGADDIFNQATIAASNMAAKMGGDASSNAIQLGKALNDPVKGITALTRVGVSFTAGQKKQVAQMVKTGDTVGAQKLILAELNKEFGGAALAAGKSLPGQMAKAKRSFEDFSQAAISKALPAINHLFTGIQGLFSAFSGEGVTSKGFTGFMERIGVAAKVFVDWIKAHWPTIKTVIGAVFTFVVAVLKQAVNVIRTYVIPAVQAVVSWVVAHWPQIKAVFGAVWTFIKPILSAFGNLLKTVWNSVLKPIVGWIQAHWPEIKTVMKVVFVAIGVAAVVAKAILVTAFRVIGVAIKGMAAGFRWVWDNVIKPVYGWIKSGIDVVKKHIGPVVTAISGLFKKIGDGLQWAWNHTIGPIIRAIESTLQHIIDMYNTVTGNPNGITSKGGTIGGGITGFGPALPGHPRAMGGPVTKGHPYVVGDGGRPELFVPNESGRILPRVPMNNGASKSVTVYQTNNYLAAVAAPTPPDRLRRAASPL